jgi:2'-5' RNA ligase
MGWVVGDGAALRGYFCSQQQLLPLLSPQPSLPPNDRLFLALIPDLEARLQIEALAQRVRSDNGLRGKPQASERLHVTLLHLGDFAGLPTEVVENAKTISADVAADMTPFEVAFDHVTSFSGKDRKPLVMGERGHHAALHGLYQRLNAAFDGIGGKRKFTPHITLLYDEQSITPHFVEPVHWQVKEIVLVHSLVGKSIHIHLGKWTLRG